MKYWLNDPPLSCQNSFLIKIFPEALHWTAPPGCLFIELTSFFFSEPVLLATNMGVSINRGTPKYMVYNGKSHLNGWFRGTPIFGNPHIYKPYLSPKTFFVQLLPNRRKVVRLEQWFVLCLFGNQGSHQHRLPFPRRWIPKLDPKDRLNSWKLLVSRDHARNTMARWNLLPWSRWSGRSVNFALFWSRLADRISDLVGPWHSRISIKWNHFSRLELWESLGSVQMFRCSHLGRFICHFHSFPVFFFCNRCYAQTETCSETGNFDLCFCSCTVWLQCSSTDSG